MPSSLFTGGPPPNIVPPVVSPSSVTGYKYDARPTVIGQTGIRAFAGDHSGRVCFTPDGTIVPARRPAAWIATAPASSDEAMTTGGQAL